MNYLIADLDCTIIKPITGNRPSNNNWEINISIDFLKKFQKIFIVTNQSDNRVNLQYIENVEIFLTSQGLSINIIKNRKRDIYRKPHVMSFLCHIRPILKKKDNITWIGDQEDDYNYFCNCLLHLQQEYTGKYFYYNICNLNTSINPVFIEDNFCNDIVQFENNTINIVYMYLLDMKSTFLNVYREYQIIKEYKSYYILKNEKNNIIIYLGRVNPILKNVNKKYILNNAQDTERIARYFQYVHYNNYVKKYITQFYEKYIDLPIIKIYPNTNNLVNKLYFLERF